ncbi:MAG TPA: prevent-host-death protein [Ruminiclostridium sp.]|jgi:prevent-host-death family protein|nr:type II toxin-antitoxin system prevent-host-death family antitoxin [Clostridiaceae bacterium]HAA25699.1 prevent-host-death protein [Ruminiclostridium sp.]
MKVPSTEVQNNFGKYLKIASELEDVIVTRNGYEVAKIVPIEERTVIAEESANYIYNDRWKLSYEEFLKMVENSDLRYEYIDGEVYLLASPAYNHQVCVSELFVIFYNWFKGKKCRPLTSPFDVTLIKSKDNINVVQPDIIIICDTDKIDASGKYKGIPDLVVEVLSGSTKTKDMVKKLDLYMQTGVKEYWIVDPDKKEVTVYRFEKNDIADHDTYMGDMTVKSKIFNGLEVKLAEIFTF